MWVLCVCGVCVCVINFEELGYGWVQNEAREIMEGFVLSKKEPFVIWKYMFQEEYTEEFYNSWVKYGTIDFIGKGNYIKSLLQKVVFFNFKVEEK